jgi:hypothetical protein
MLIRMKPKITEIELQAEIEFVAENGETIRYNKRKRVTYGNPNNPNE